MNAITLTIEDGIAIITLDVPGESVNIVSRGVRDALRKTFDDIERSTEIRAAVLLSGKDSFIAGADIDEFLQWKTSADAEAASREGHGLLDRLERLRAPVVAAVHGACMGGGTEAILACAYRIATDHPKTVVALPEVQLGLLPGAGGTQRLPRTVGLQTALDMILTGKTVRARKAAQIGLVHELVHPAILRSTAIERAKQLAEGRIPRNPPARHHTARNLLLDDNPVGRAVVFRQAREQTLAKTHGKYPAPLAAIEAIAAGYQGAERGYREEARLFGELAMTPVCRELIYLFFATTALKKDSGVDGDVPEPAPVAKLGVLGAGFMGAGIAAIAAQQGTIVRMKDASLDRIGKGLAAIRDVLKDRLSKKQITRQQFDDMLLLVGGTVDDSGFGSCDLVIEAVFEDLAVKHQVLQEMEPRLPAHAVFASNTSTIPIARIAAASSRPDRVLGMHFFSPVHRMPLLEVIVTPRTSPAATVTAVNYGRQLGKTVIVVHDSPGFYVNRILAPYLNEAGRLLDTGVAIDAVDRALLDFGFPVGPVTLLDEVGLDIAGKSGAIFFEAFGERLLPAQSLRRVVESGRMGRKGKKGFYLYDENGKKGGVDASVYELLPTGAQRAEVASDEIQRRCVLAMCNEAARCVEEGIVRSPRDGDIGAVFGIGFPPFLGGPLRYLDSLGAAHAVELLEELNFRFAPRFAPCDLLLNMAAKGERFHSPNGGNV
ncbi:MAG: Fatty acid oxidation complex subunit alpha [Gemmatimonadaceae bacterium]|nr:Fatty acid oxidation complex subunit alpha [Gemmatimonadaceae bacterium]